MSIRRGSERRARTTAETVKDTHVDTTRHAVIGGAKAETTGLVKPGGDRREDHKEVEIQAETTGLVEPGGDRRGSHKEVEPKVKTEKVET